MRLGEDSDAKQIAKDNRRINYIIYVCRAFATLIILAIFSVAIYKDRTVKPDGKYATLTEARNAFITDLHDITAEVFMALTCLLVLSVCVLIWRLYEKFRRMQDEQASHLFAKEMRTLIAILVFFSTSYLIRVLCYSWIVNWISFIKPFEPCMKQGSTEVLSTIYYSNTVYFVAMPLIYDFLPIGAILFFHKRNFTIKQNKDKDAESTANSE